MEKIVIIGAGGFGKEVAWTVERINHAGRRVDLVGFCDHAPDKQSGLFAGVHLLGDPLTVLCDLAGCRYFCAIGNNRVRKSIMEALDEQGILPATLIDPAAFVAPDAKIGEGSFVGIGSIVSVGATVGKGVVINSQSTVGHDVTVGDYAQLCPGVRLSGGCEVGQGVLFGTNAGTVPGRRIGDWATVGAGTMAIRHVAAGQTLMRV